MIKELIKFAQIELPHTATDSAKLVSVINIFLAILGAVAFLVLVIAGVQFTVSGGNPEKVAKARNAIIYALIGVIVAIFAAVIVNFVITSL